MTPEQKLQALMQAQRPQQRDALFEIAVLERLAKRRAVNRLTHLSMAMLVAGGLLAAVVTGGQAALPSLVAVAGAGGLAALVVWTLSRARAA